MREISGLIYQYYHICKRKMWYAYHGINMESENEDVQIGKIIDQTSYKREHKHVLIDDYANIDFLKDHAIYEIKKSSKQAHAAKAQIKYYLYILHNKNIENLSGELRIPKENKVEKITLTQDDIDEIEQNLIALNNILSQKIPPSNEKTRICKRCAYFDLCFI